MEKYWACWYTTDSHPNSHFNYPLGVFSDSIYATKEFLRWKNTNKDKEFCWLENQSGRVIFR